MNTINNIILVGMPGSGKSTVGVILAKTMGFDFVDTDLIICNKEGDTLQNIIDKKGLKEFLEIEREVAKNLKFFRTVVATGGSVILNDEAMQNLKQQGYVVYLDVSLEELERRITNITTRGIAFEEGETLADIFEKRTALYKKYADISISVSDRTGSTEAVVAKVIEYLKELEE